MSLNIPEDFLEASEKVGKNKILVQGAGGNTSCKVGKFLFIKASGKRLDQAKKEDIFVKVDLKKVIDSIKNNIKDPVIGSYDQKQQLRPSIETSLHAIIPYKFVFHVHCLNTLSWVVQNFYEEKIKDLLFDFDFISLPYLKPGLTLTKELSKIINKKKSKIIFLGNHGLVLAGDNLIEVIQTLYKISDRLYVKPKKKRLPNVELLEELTLGSKYRPSIYENSHQIALDENSIKIVRKGSLYPDNVVFLGPSAIICKNQKDLKNIFCFAEKMPIMPIIVISNAGVIVPKEISLSGEEMVNALSVILSKIHKNTELNFLSKKDEDELLNWSAEKYRKSIQKL